MLSRAPRSVQFSGNGFIVVFFVLMSGGAASAARAGVMALVAVLARGTGRIFLASRALALSAFLIVLWNPYELVFDPSFQLSALATVGLVVFTPLFAQWLTSIPERLALREIASSTIATQLAVVPLLLYQNGQVAIYALPANLLALAAIPPAMFFSFIGGLLGIAFGSFATAAALPAYLLLSYVIAVARLFASLPYAHVSIGVFGAGWMAAAYAILFIGAWYLHAKRKPAASNAAGNQDTKNAS